MARPSLPRSIAPILVIGLCGLLIAVGVIRYGSHAEVVTPPAGSESIVPGGHVPSQTSSADAARGNAVPRRSRFAGAETIEERWLEDPAASQASRRVRLVRLPGHDGPVRLIEDFASDPVSGERRVRRVEAMRADAVLVAVPAGSTAPALAGRLRAAGFDALAPSEPDAVVSVRVPELALDAVPVVLDAITAGLPGLVAEPDFIRFPSQTTPDDYDVARLWSLEKIEAPAAWAVTTGDASVIVAVIDSGVALTHPDLAANVWTNPGEIPGNGLDDDGNGFIDDLRGWNFAGSNANVADTSGHGSHVAGTIGAVGDNGTGIVGVNWRVRVLPVRAGSGTFSDSALLNALRYVTLLRQRGANIVAANMSLGGTGFSATFRQEVINARNAGVLLVAAAGNIDDDTPEPNNDAVPVYPASYDVDSIIAVASSNHGDRLSVFSHFGVSSVDLAAPGTAILSTVTDAGYERFDGTSMAAPHVAGALALVAAAETGLTAAQLRARILDTVDPVPALAGRVATGGRLNLRRAVAPGLVRPRVALTVGGAPARVAALDRAGVPLALGATLQPENGVTPAASLAWTMVSGPAAVAFSAPADAATSATFPVAGRYRVRVTATAGALAETADLVVAVGDTSVTTEGLRAWWRFDDTGAETADSSGDGRNGSVVSAIRSPEAVLGTSMQFDGSTSRVGFSSPALTRVTIAAWARASGINNLTIFPRVVHMREGLLFGGFDTGATDDGNMNTLKFTLDNGATEVVWHSPAGSLQLGGWHHVAVTYDPTATYPAPTFYINGVRQLTGTQDSVASAPTVAAGTGYIGDRGDGTRGWLGLLDEVRVYDRALGEDEIVWMSREVALQALAGGTLDAGDSGDPFTVPLAFSPAATGQFGSAIVASSWSEAGGEATFTTTGANAATAAFTAPGARLVRFDAVTGDGVHVTRTLAVDVPSITVDRAGYFTGTTSDGGVWTLLVRGDGTGTFFGGSSVGSFQRDIMIPTWGIFTFVDRGGSTVTGRILGDGTVAGSIGGASTFSGARTSAGASEADPARDGIYSGWLVDSGVRAAAQIDRGRVSIVVEESGADRAAAGAIDPSGAFSLAPAAGVSFAGAAAAGRLDATVAFPESPARTLVVLRDGRAADRRLVNLSVRGTVGAGDAVLVPGFVIEGSGMLPVLLRGIGPGLADFGVADALQQPRLVLRQGASILRENAGWNLDGHAAEIVAANTLTGAFALDPDVRDAALTLPLAALPHTVEVVGAAGGAGVALAELYDARAGGETAVISNLSGRGFVGTGDAILVGGFVVRGEAPVLVLVRAAGPALGEFGVGGVLAQPRLRVMRGSAELASAGSWSAGGSGAVIAEAAARVGAFPFAAGAADAALLLSLPPGDYTAQVSGAGDTTGIALLEIYRVEGM